MCSWVLWHRSTCVFVRCVQVVTVADGLPGIQQKMKANKETVEAVSQEIEGLNQVIANIGSQVKARVDSLRMSAGEKMKLCEDMKNPEWQTRVASLQK